MDQLAKKTVSYFYDEEYADHSLGGSNPMRPHRVRLTNRLLEGYNLTQRMRVHRPRALDYEHLNYFHADGAQFSLRAWGTSRIVGVSPPNLHARTGIESTSRETLVMEKRAFIAIRTVIMYRHLTDWY